MASAADCPICLTAIPTGRIRVLHVDRGVAHLACATCAPGLQECPFCRVAITETMALRSVGAEPVQENPSGADEDGAPPEDVRVDDRRGASASEQLRSPFHLFLSVALVICYGYMATGTVEGVRSGPFCTWNTSAADNPSNIKPTTCSFGGRLADIWFVLILTAGAIVFSLPSLLRRVMLNTAAWSVDSAIGDNNYLRIVEWLTFLYAAVFAFVWLFLAVNAFFRQQFAPGGDLFAIPAAADGIHSLAAATNMFFAIFSIMNLVFWSLAVGLSVAPVHAEMCYYWLQLTLKSPVLLFLMIALVICYGYVASGYLNIVDKLIGHWMRDVRELMLRFYCAIVTPLTADRLCQNDRVSGNCRRGC